MEKQVSWFDRIVNKLCERIFDLTSSRRRLALFGNGMAGLDSFALLPVDRRLGPNTMAMSPHNNMATVVSRVHKKTGKTDSKECNFWAYCYMNGQPCVWCGGGNALVPKKDAKGKVEAPDLIEVGKAQCPKGKTPVTAWYGCCENPTTKELVMIGFLDCCGSGFCKFMGLDRCKNWPDAKDWCYYGGENPTTHNTGPKSYYCTVAVHVAPCP